MAGIASTVASVGCVARGQRADRSRVFAAVGVPLLPQQLRACAPSSRRFVSVSATSRHQTLLVSAMAAAKVAKKRALVSVFDKTELTTLAKGLIALGFEAREGGESEKIL